MKDSYELSCEDFAVTEAIRSLSDSATSEIYRKVPYVHFARWFLRTLGPNAFKALLRIRLPGREVVVSADSRNLYEAMRKARSTAIHQCHRRLRKRNRVKAHGHGVAHHRAGFWHQEEGLL